MTKGRGTDVMGDAGLYTSKMSDAVRKRQHASTVWNYFIESVRYARRVLESLIANCTAML